MYENINPIYGILVWTFVGWVAILTIGSYIGQIISIKKATRESGLRK